MSLMVISVIVQDDLLMCPVKRLPLMKGMKYIKKIRSYNELEFQKRLPFLQFELQTQPYFLLQGQTTMPVAEESSLDILHLKVYTTHPRG